MIFLFALLGGLPAVVAAIWLLWGGAYSTELRWTLVLVIGSAWLGFAAELHSRVVRPLQTMANLLSALREGDFSVRARGAGRITHYEGLDELLAEYGDHVVAVDLLPVGAPRRDWRATLIADGMVIVRHPELSQTLTMAQRFASDLRLYAA